MMIWLVDFMDRVKTDCNADCRAPMPCWKTFGSARALASDRAAMSLLRMLGSPKVAEGSPDGLVLLRVPPEKRITGETYPDPALVMVIAVTAPPMMVAVAVAPEPLPPSSMMVTWGTEA